MSGVVLTHDEWLAQIRPGDEVAVVAGTRWMEIAQVTSTSRTLITIGKHAKRTNFRRKDGRIAGRRPLGHLFRLEQP